VLRNISRFYPGPFWGKRSRTSVRTACVRTGYPAKQVSTSMRSWRLQF